MAPYYLAAILAGAVMLDEFDRAAGRAHVMLAVPMIGGVESVEVDSFTPGDAEQ